MWNPFSTRPEVPSEPLTETLPLVIEEEPVAPPVVIEEEPLPAPPPPAPEMEPETVSNDGLDHGVYPMPQHLQRGPHFFNRKEN